MNPACKYNVIDFYYDGGVPRLMENLQTMLETDAMTVTAHTLAENIASHKYRYPATGLVNHTMDDPFGYTGGVAVLRGNLAPDTGITKPGAFDKSLHHFEGEAICFDSEEAAEEAILAGKVRDGHVVVIRYEGPKGGPGMREMYKAMKYLYGRGAQQDYGADHGRPVLRHQQRLLRGAHLPEAAEGGPIAIIHDGDRIVIDIESRRLDLMVPPGGDRRPPEGLEAAGAQVQEGLAGPLLQDRRLRLRGRRPQIRQPVRPLLPPPESLSFGRRKLSVSDTGSALFSSTNSEATKISATAVLFLSPDHCLFHHHSQL